MPVIQLYDIEQPALIVPFASGVIYTNQAGGQYCLQPKVEGVMVPLGSEGDLEAKLEAFFTTLRHRLRESDADALDALFNPPDGSYSPMFFLAVDRTKLEESMEAWLYVTITSCPEEHMVGFHSHGDGTYSNVTTLSGRRWNPADQPELSRMPYMISGFRRGQSAILTWQNSD